MELTTHFTFGVVIGLIFFGKPEAAILIGFGTLIPDLDREYWFVPLKEYREEQYHRALLHNVFVLAAVYLVSPFISLGVFLHIIQDCLTTVRDRGVEPMYPFTRLVKRGWLSGEYKEESHTLTEHIYFYQEDDKGLLNEADEDFRKVGDDPVPWRRIYGFALNSRILDHWFLFASIALVYLWLLTDWPANYEAIVGYFTGGSVWLIGYIGIVIIYFAGELDRHKEWPTVPPLNYLKYLVMLIGSATLGYWLFLNLPEISVNIGKFIGYLPVYVVGVVLVAAAGLLVLYLERHTQKNMIV